MRVVVGLVIALGAAALFLVAAGPSLQGHIGLQAAALGDGAIALRGLTE